MKNKDVVENKEVILYNKKVEECISENLMKKIFMYFLRLAFLKKSQKGAAWPLECHAGQSAGQSGAALLTTIIIISMMILSTGVMAREILSEIRVANALDNSTIAYYAAEAGVEQALLQIRYNNEYETSADLTETDNKFVRWELDSDQKIADNVDPYTTNVPDPSKRYFDLKVWYKSPKIGAATDLGPDDMTNPKLLQDDVAEFEIPGQATLQWYVPPATEIGIGNAIKTEVIGYNKNGDQVCLDVDTCRYWKKVCAGCHSPILEIKPSPGETKTLDKIRIKPWFVKYLTGEGATAPAGKTAYIKFTISPPSGKVLGSSFTTIESIGSYGGVKRKLVAKVDRTSGNLVGLFDYVIYSASDLCKPACP